VVLKQESQCVSSRTDGVEQNRWCSVHEGWCVQAGDYTSENARDKAAEGSENI
jgi:hypothetical protein